MITERDLQEAIAECLNKKNPDSSTCIKLAAFYTIQNELYGNKGEQYSFASEPTTENTINYNSGTAFSGLVNGKNMKSVMMVMEDLMDTLSVLQPPLHKAVIRKLTDL